MGMYVVRAGVALVAACAFWSGVVGCGKNEPVATTKDRPPAAVTIADGGPAITAAAATAAPTVALDAPPTLREHGASGTAKFAGADGAADRTTAFAHGRVALALPGVWSVQADSKGSLTAVSDDLRDAVLTLDAPASSGGKTIDVFLTARLDALARGLEILERSPASVVAARSKSGVPFAVQTVRARLEDGTELWFTAVAVDTGGGEAQQMVLLAGNVAKLKALTKLVGPAMATMTVTPPAAATKPPSGSTGQPKGEGGSVLKDTGNDSYVWGVWSAQSPRLPAIGYAIKYNLRIDVLSPEDLQVARDAAGTMYVNYAEQLSDSSPIADNVFGFPAGGGAKGVKTGIGDASVQAAAKQAWNTGVEVMYLGGFSLDGAGNMLVRASLYFTDRDGFFWFGKDGTTSVAVGPSYVAKLADGGDYLVFETARMNPDGTVWLFVRHEDTKFDMALVSPGANGKWSANAFEPRFHADYPPPDVNDIPSGNPDYKGDWTFFSNGVVWQIDRKGGSTPIARLDIAAEGVRFSGPVVLKNGDIWLAVNRVIDAEIYVTVDPNTGITKSTSGQYYVGDRSRLIRFRHNAKGGLDAGEIGGDDVLATLVKSGAKVPYDTLFDLRRLQLDPATGGLLGVEIRNAQVLVIVPKD